MARNATIQESVNELMMLHAMGRFTDMEQRARAFLKSFAGSPILYQLLGLALAGQNRYNDALSYFQRAARGDPADAQFWENLASCQVQIGDHAEAERSLTRALALEPHSHNSLATLAGVLYALKRHDDAGTAAEQALAIAPHHAGANFQLGRVLALQSELGRAEHHLQQALAGGNVAPARLELGMVQRRRGALTEAEANLRRAIALGPGNPVAHANLGLTLGAMGRPDDAVSAVLDALQALGEVGANPSSDELSLLDTLADILDEAGNSSQAVNIYRTALNAKPVPARALRAIVSARRAGDWAFAASLEPLALRVAEEGSEVDNGTPARLSLCAGATAALQLATARKCAQRVLSVRLPAIHRPAVIRRRHSRMRIGYAYADSSHRAAAHLRSGILDAHDRSAFEIIGYDLAPPTRTGDSGLAAFDRVVALGDVSNEMAAQTIADDNVDVLIDTNGWTDHARPAVLAARPAALQVAWLSCPASLGAPWIDYLVADKILAPVLDEVECSENIIRLQDGYRPVGHNLPVAENSGTPHPDGAEARFVFCSFEEMDRLTPEIFEIWLDLLAALEGAVLRLIAPQPSAAETVRAAMAARGLDLDRLDLVPKFERHARLVQPHLMLDCFPCGSPDVVGEQLRAGVLPVTMIGDTLASRATASIITAAGVPELVARSRDEYRELALRLAREPSVFARLHKRLCNQHAAAAVFDVARFTRQFERALHAIHDRHLTGLPPDHIDIS